MLQINMWNQKEKLMYSTINDLDIKADYAIVQSYVYVMFMTFHKETICGHGTT